MEDQNLKTTKVGNVASEKLKNVPCEVLHVEIELIEKAKTNKAVFYLKHPDKEEEIKISNVTLMRQKKGKKEIVNVATWISLDKNSELQMDSALAALLKYYSATNLMEMVGKTVQTDVDEQGYLTIKAY